MKDHFGRSISYLRISVTDRCNLRCRYCMPENGIQKCSHRDILSLEEVLEIASAAVALGIRKIRLTGGEPLVRRGLLSLCSALSALPGLDTLCLTTNGQLLPQMAAELHTAGVRRVNISLDSLNPDTYRYITRGGDLAAAMAGIYAALDAGFDAVKLNVVLLGGINDDEISVLAGLSQALPLSLRFIELMPIGSAADLADTAYLPCSRVLAALPQLEPLPQQDGVAALYRLPGAVGTVGLISPLSNCFCPGCDRIRLTADGCIKPCLHSQEELSLRGLHGAALRSRLAEAIAAKPLGHQICFPASRSQASRDMYQIGG